MQVEDLRYWTGDGGNALKFIAETPEEEGILKIIEDLLATGGKWNIEGFKVEKNKMQVAVDWPKATRK